MHTHADTNSNVNVNETSDITIRLADLTQAEQTTNNMLTATYSDRCAQTPGQPATHQSSRCFQPGGSDSWDGQSH